MRFASSLLAALTATLLLALPASADIKQSEQPTTCPTELKKLIPNEELAQLSEEICAMPREALTAGNRAEMQVPAEITAMISKVPAPRALIISISIADERESTIKQVDEWANWFAAGFQGMMDYVAVAAFDQQGMPVQVLHILLVKLPTEEPANSGKPTKKDSI